MRWRHGSYVKRCSQRCKPIFFFNGRSQRRFSLFLPRKAFTIAPWPQRASTETQRQGARHKLENHFPPLKEETKTLVVPQSVLGQEECPWVSVNTHQEAVPWAASLPCQLLCSAPSGLSHLLYLPVFQPDSIRLNIHFVFLSRNFLQQKQHSTYWREKI